MNDNSIDQLSLKWIQICIRDWRKIVKSQDISSASVTLKIVAFRRHAPPLQKLSTDFHINCRQFD